MTTLTGNNGVVYKSSDDNIFEGNNGLVFKKDNNDSYIGNNGIVFAKLSDDTYESNNGLTVRIVKRHNGELSPNLFKFEYMNDNRSNGVHFYNEKLDTDLLQPGTYSFTIGKIVTLKGSETMTDSDGNIVNVVDSDTSGIVGRYLMRLYDENKKLVQKPIANGWLNGNPGNTFGACYDLISNGQYYHTQRSADVALETVTIIVLLKPAYLQLGYADGSASQTGNSYTNVSHSKSFHPRLAKGSLPSEYSAYNRNEEDFSSFAEIDNGVIFKIN